MMSGYPQILEAVKKVRTQVRWKPNRAESHLRKRKMRGHLPQEATIEDYEGIILKLLQDKSSGQFCLTASGDDGNPSAQNLFQDLPNLP